MIYYFDIIGAMFSLIATILYIRLNPIAWPVSLLAIVIGIGIYCARGLYGDMALHFLYLCLSLYGWYAWLYGGKQYSKLPVSNLSLKLAGILAASAVIATLAVCYILSHYTDSQLPYWDASTTVLCLIAEWLTCRKILQCWLVWLVVDALLSGMYFYKLLPAHGVLLAGYVLLAVLGYLRWRRQLPY